jgi:hypothetical protein
MYRGIMSAGSVKEANEAWNAAVSTLLHTHDLTTALAKISELHCFYLERVAQLEMFDLPLAEEDLGPPVQDWLN